MERRELGRSGVAATRIVLGCGNFGGVGSSAAFFGQGIAHDEAFRIMDAAWELGIRTFDTADAYGGGRSESWIGEWLAEKGSSVRDAVAIETKTFNPMESGADHGLSRARIERQLESSLRAARRRPSRPLPRARVRPRHAAGGDPVHVRRARPGGEGSRRRRIQLHGRATRGGGRDRRARGSRPLRMGAELLLAPRGG